MTPDARSLRVVFTKLQADFTSGRSEPDGLICKHGHYLDSEVLKLQKASWTNDRMDRTENTSGVFFSVWVEEARADRLNYNIHAFKLRHLKGYTITSRDFADTFRAAFKPQQDTWPKVRTDYGPLTLMQGWIAIDPRTVEQDVRALLNRFARNVGPIVDRLLDQRRRRPVRV